MDNATGPITGIPEKCPLPCEKGGWMGWILVDEIKAALPPQSLLMLSFSQAFAHPLFISTTEIEMAINVGLL